jgi:hypothetical protein
MGDFAGGPRRSRTVRRHMQPYRKEDVRTSSGESELSQDAARA